MLNIDDMISQLRRYRPSLVDSEVFFAIQRGEIEVENVLRPYSKSKLAHLFQDEVTKTLTSSSPNIVLPSHAGDVLRVEVSGIAVPALSIASELAVNSNYLYKNAAVRKGNKLSFSNIPESTVYQKEVGVEARVVYETSFQSPVFVDGFYGFVTNIPYTESGVKLTVIEVYHPKHRQWKDDYLNGATLRLYSDHKSAREWTVFRNYVDTKTEMVDNIQREVDHQLLVMNDDLNTLMLNFPSFTMKGKAFPLRITRIGVPPSIREAVMLWAKSDITNDPRHRHEYLEYLESLGVSLGNS